MIDARTPLIDEVLPDFLFDTYVVLDLAGVIRDANRALSSLIGHARQYAIGKPLIRYLEESTRGAFTARLASVRTSGQSQDFAARMPGLRRGPARDVRIRLGAIDDGTGEIIGLRCLIRDITDETVIGARLAQIEAEHQQEMRTRTMELEAIVRMLQAQLGDRVAGQRNATARTLLGSLSPPSNHADDIPFDLDAHRRERSRQSAPPAR